MLYLSHNKQERASYLLLFRFKQTPTADKLEAIKDALIKMSDNKFRQLSSNQLATFVGFIVYTNLTASGIKAVIDGATEIVYSSPLEKTDELLITELHRNAVWLGNEFHRAIHWGYRKNGMID